MAGVGLTYEKGDLLFCPHSRLALSVFPWVGPYKTFKILGNWR